jgi:hypothetical protein
MAYGRRKLWAIFEGNVQEKWKRHRFACLTINFDDMHSILDIFFIKAVCPDCEQVGLSRSDDRRLNTSPS